MRTTTALLLAVLLAGCGKQPKMNPVEQPPSGRHGRTDDVQTIEVELLDFDGIQKLIASKQGKVVVLDAWSTSCVPCVQEFPKLVALHQKHDPAQLACISLSFDYEGIGKPELQALRVLEFLVKEQATFDNVLSTEDDETLYRKFSLSSVPAVFVYDRTGTLRKRFDNEAGGEPFTYEQVGELVDQLLAEPKTP